MGRKVKILILSLLPLFVNAQTRNYLEIQNLFIPDNRSGLNFDGELRFNFVQLFPSYWGIKTGIAVITDYGKTDERIGGLWVNVFRKAQLNEFVVFSGGLNLGSLGSYWEVGGGVNIGVEFDHLAFLFSSEVGNLFNGDSSNLGYFSFGVSGLIKLGKK